MASFDPEHENVPVICTTVTIAVQDGTAFPILRHDPQWSSKGKNQFSYVIAKCSGLADLSRHHGCHFTIYPNGFEKKNKGYVSVRLSASQMNICFEGTCIVSLIDSTDTPRFTQTFTIPYPTISYFYIEKYISRERLLSDPNDLLPNGLLILRIELELTLYPEEHDRAKPVSDLNIRYHFDGRPDELLLDSPLAKRLSELSTFFRAILVSPMKEMRTRVMSIEKRKIGAFRDTAQLVMGSNIMTFHTLKSIFDMYLFGDEYDIPFVCETCLCFLKLYASAHVVDELMECVNEYEDESLKELVEKQVMLLSKTNLTEEIVKTDLHVCLKKPVYEYLWMYTYSSNYFKDRFVYTNVAKKYMIEEEEENYRHDFYR